jgi:hypothetical protein
VLVDQAQGSVPGQVTGEDLALVELGGAAAYEGTGCLPRGPVQ